MEHPKEFAEGLSIGIIMDGNGRWAKTAACPALPGTKKAQRCSAILPTTAMNWAFRRCTSMRFLPRTGSARWKKVNAIMRLFGEYLLKGFDYKNRNIRIKFMGDRTVLDPKSCSS